MIAQKPKKEMATSNGTQNGKVDILARAMADVFQECMEKTRVSAKKDLGEAKEAPKPARPPRLLVKK